MNAQLRWRAVACANHMDFVDALAPFEVTNQPSDAAAGVAIYLWQEQRDIKLHLVSHNAILFCRRRRLGSDRAQRAGKGEVRSEEHTSELQSLMRISYAVFCLKKNKI